MKKKRKSKQKFYSLLLTTLAVTQFIGCGKAESINEENIEEFYIDDYVSEHDFDTLDEIIVTYSEEGIELSNTASVNIEDIFNIENEDIATTYFYITEDRVERQFVEYAAQPKTVWHYNDVLYDETNNEILWDKVVNVIYQNSLSNAEFDYSALSREDVEYVVELLKKYVFDLQRDFPELDIEEVACKLETVSLFYIPTDFITYAATSRDYIVYFDDEKNIRTFDANSNISIHEFFHFVCFGCECKDRIGRYIADGINLDTPVLSVNLETKERTNYQDLNLYGFHYTFIEEAAAERSKFNYTMLYPTTYYNYQKVTDNIEFVLSLDKNYKMDSYVEDCIYKRPIHFIREFPVGEADVKENFTDNVRMLVIYDVLLRFGYPNADKLNNCLVRCETEEEINENLAQLINYSQSQLTKLFFTNLIILNEEHSEEFNLTYYLYLVNLFEARMKQTNRILINLWELPKDYSRVVDSYENYFNEMKNYYVSYLTEYYQNNGYQDVFTIMNTKDDYLPVIEYYPNYVKDDRIIFYKYLENDLENDFFALPRRLNLTKQ